MAGTSGVYHDLRHIQKMTSARWFIDALGANDSHMNRISIVALFTVSACSSMPVTPTWSQSVQPIIANHCQSFHQPGAIAPISLTSYDEAKAMSAAIVSAVKSRRMPPHPADNSGSCGQWQNANWLSDEQISTLEQWAQSGALEGPKAAATPIPEDRTLKGANVVEVPIAPSAYSPTPSSTGGDDYRCFLVEAPVASGPYFLTGYEVLAGNPKVVHHMILYIPTSQADVNAFAALDAMDAAPGYSCFGGASGEGNVGRASIAGAWAPGGGAINYPGNTGIQLTGGLKLVVQMHYNVQPADRGATDLTKIRFSFATQGISPGLFLPFGPNQFELPPMSKNAPVGYQSTLGGLFTGSIMPGGDGGMGPMGGINPAMLANSRFRLLAVFPHMHGHGTSITLRKSSDCIVDIPRWDYHWQLTYMLQRPVTLGGMEEMQLSCTFDTSNVTQPIRWGEGTLDEMCVVGLYVTPSF
jgi:hypothetical protein